MKYFKDSNNKIFAYAADGSQDHAMKPNLTAITQEEANTLISDTKQAEFDKLNYVIKRRNSYPPITDYVDAWVKSDTVALEAYKQACLNVKARFPKS